MVIHNTNILCVCQAANFDQYYIDKVTYEHRYFRLTNAQMMQQVVSKKRITDSKLYYMLTSCSLICTAMYAKKYFENGYLSAVVFSL